MENSNYDTDDRRPMSPRVPWWMYVVIVLCMAPGLCFPWAISLASEGGPVVKALVWLYPAYVLLSGLLAWLCYGRRTVLTWIVLILLVLSHAGMYTLTFMPLG